MEAFLRGMKKGLNKEGIVRDALVAHLSESVKEVQLEWQQLKPGAPPLSSSDSINSLCIVLEAVFIHGLKDTFVERVSLALTSDPDYRPQPNFWGPLLVFSHRDLLNQVNNLSQIVTDVGRCRAWVRLALNESLLPSYLSAMRSEGSALHPYYRRSAFLRDGDHLEVAERLLDGLAGCVMQVAANSSLLNTWVPAPLLMAGLWTPPLRAGPVAAGVDVASTLEVYIPSSSRPAPTPTLLSSTPVSGLGDIAALDEDQALRIILASTANVRLEEDISSSILSKDDEKVVQHTIQGQKSFLDNRVVQKTFHDGDKGEQTVVQDTSDSGEQSQKRVEFDSKNNDPIPSVEEASKTCASVPQESSDCDASSLGNSLIGRVGWSSSFEEADISPTKDCSYSMLVDTYSVKVKSPDFREYVCDPLPKPVSPSDEVEDLNHQHYLSLLGHLAQEHGLDSQNYACLECRRPLGPSFGQFRLCSFNGGYYCLECHTGEERLIPARIIHNWEFRRYPVSRTAAAFLLEIHDQPLIDMRVLNPHIYVYFSEMAELQTIRKQLYYLRNYLLTCREPIMSEFRKKLWPREYLYEHVHLYSIADLESVPCGVLQQQLESLVKLGRTHVLTCFLCNQKGFVCELCASPQVIYPFDMDSTLRCPNCGAVFHVSCWSAGKQCPKCSRRRLRENAAALCDN